MLVIDTHMYVWMCISVVFTDACNILGVSIPITAKAIARAVTQIPSLTFLISTSRRTSKFIFVYLFQSVLI